MKKFITLTVFLFTVFFSHTVLAQGMRSTIGGYEFSFPEKVQKLLADPLPAGTYSVGANGDFPTIDAAFDKLSNDGIAGEVTLELIDDLYTAPTNTSGFAIYGPIPGADENNRVIIKPAHNKNVTVEGNGEKVFNFVNTSYLTLDGVNLTGSTTLTIHAQYNNQFSSNAAVVFQENSDHNVVQNITASSEDFNRRGCAIFLYGAFWTPDSNLIQNNFIKSGLIGIIIVAVHHSYFSEGNIVRGNIVGSEVDSLMSRGIHVEHCHNTIVENNIVQNIKVSNSEAEDINTGISSYGCKGDTIRNNVVYNIKASAGYTGAGILLYGYTGELGSDNLVYNNMVYDIQSSSEQDDSRVAGIQVRYQNNPKIYYNSIYLSGTGQNKSGSATLYIADSCYNVDLKNNILINTRDESQYCASAIYDYSTSNLTSDNNDFYYDDINQNNCMVRIGGTNYSTLEDWQISSGQDANSVSKEVFFVSSTDLHLTGSSVGDVDLAGTPIAGITTDIDGEDRGLLYPYIGADESTIPLPVELVSNTTPIDFTLQQNYPNPFNPSTKIKYSIPNTSKVQLKVFDVLGKEIETLVNEEKPAGTYEVEFNSHSGEVRNLPSGVYFYQLRAGDFIQTKKMILIK